MSFFASPMLAQQPKITVLPSEVNQQDATQECPIMSYDGKRLYFTRKVQGEKGDIYYAELNSVSGTFSKAIALGQNVNNAAYNAAFGIAQDGNTLYIMDNYSNKSILATTQDKGNGWSEPESIIITELAEVYDSLSKVEASLNNHNPDDAYSQLAWISPSADLQTLVIHMAAARQGCFPLRVWPFLTHFDPEQVGQMIGWFT